ncbi:MAG: hypothetical protein L0Y42_14655 [Phycisphaerales bacterium]|nr:hypothetical protein [Phycisphaerales bacterium]
MEIVVKSEVFQNVYSHVFNEVVESVTVRLISFEKPNHGTWYRVDAVDHAGRRIDGYRDAWNAKVVAIKRYNLIRDRIRHRQDSARRNAAKPTSCPS